MEELIYLLPFDAYSNEVIIAVIIIGLIIFATVLRLLRVPQTLMVIAVGAVAMTAYMSFQVDGPSPYQPLVNVAQRQKQLDQQFQAEPLNFGEISLTHVKVRLHSLTLTLKNNTPIDNIASTQDLDNFASSYLTTNHDQYCEMLRLEQALPYRRTNQSFFNLTIKKYEINFIIDDKTTTVDIPVDSCPKKGKRKTN